MIKNYFKIAFRNFRKGPVFSAINVFGLSIGLTSCLLIALYIRHELSYDRFQANGGRIARMIMEYRFDGGGQSIKGNFTSTKVAPVFKRTFPEVLSAARMTEYTRVVGFGDKLFTEPGFMYADSSFFDLFSFPILQGDPHTALSGPGKGMLTRSAAMKYFGNRDPLGKILRVGTDSGNGFGNLYPGCAADPFDRGAHGQHTGDEDGQAQPGKEPAFGIDHKNEFS
jgi:putative ABC transport system permease protein